MCVQEGISGYLIPVFIREIQTRRFPLNTSAIDVNVCLTTHYVEGLLEEIFDGVEIIEVAVHDLGGATESADGIQGLQVWRSAGGRISVNEANERASLSQRYSTSGTDAWRRSYGPCGEEICGRKIRLEAPVTRATR